MPVAPAAEAVAPASAGWGCVGFEIVCRRRGERWLVAGRSGRPGRCPIVAGDRWHVDGWTPGRRPTPFDGPPEVADLPTRSGWRLEALAQGLGIGERVTWHGAVPQSRLAEYYRGATALVVPSVGEGLGLVAVEAQLCETPVVAFDSGGLPDVVQHDRTGILVREVDAGALAAALVSLLERDDRGAALGAAGRLHALATFAPESVAQRYAGIYRSAIAQSPA